MEVLPLFWRGLLWVFTIAQYLLTAAIEFSVNSLLALFGKSSLFYWLYGIFHYYLFLLFQIRLVCTFFLTVLISHLLISRWHYWSGIPSQLNLEVLKENLSSEYAVKTQCQASARQLGKNSMDLSQITDCENCK